MDKLSSLMIRAALCWLGLGVLIGAAMLSWGVWNASWLLSLRPGHIHMLVVGWLIQFALGVGYWLFPRMKPESKTWISHRRIGVAAFIAVNVGLAGRVVLEPLLTLNVGSRPLAILLFLSGILQALAVLVFIAQLWPRVGPRKRP